MLNRLRTGSSYEPTYASWTRSDTTAHSGPPPCAQSTSVNTSRMEALYPRTYSKGTIEDYVVVPHVKIRRRRRNVLNGIQRAVKPVHHVKVSLDNFKDVEGNAAPNQGDTTFSQSVEFHPGGCNETITRTETCPPLAFFAARHGPDWFRDNILANLPTGSGISYASVEWTELADKFNEGCKSLIPSNFFAGEAFAEGSIYLDAIRLVTNPAKSISGFIKDVQKRGLRRSRLGELNLYYKKLFSNKTFLKSDKAIQTAKDLGFVRFSARELIDRHLSFKFGVLPAIHDLNSTIASHSAVEDRLLYLNKHRGRYVPIRVKKKFPASFTPSDPSSYFLDLQYALKDAFTVAHIFGQGRIRTDINDASRWRAYAEYFGLNKIVGTAWELIPFSFVADWFLNIQEKINELTNLSQLGESPFMNLTSIGYSYKNVAVYDYLVMPGYDLTEGFPNMEPSEPFPCFSFAITDYTRYPGFPDTSWFANLSNLGSFHYTAGGELLLQKLL